MKFVNFHSVTLQNFLSVGSEPVKVDFTRGLHVITGINRDKQDRRNGVGKSTIADAIHFAIFGSTIRDLKKENIVNHLTGSGTVVELIFTITDRDVSTEYKITRSLEPSRCKLYINGIDETRDTIANTTEYVCNLINATQEIFQNCVIMTVNHTVPFMAKKKVEKRKFIEGIFNLEVFGQMLSQLRSEYNDVKKDIEVEQARFQEVENMLKQYNQDKQDNIAAKQKRYTKLINRKSNNDSQLKELKIKTFDSDGSEMTKISDSITKLTENFESCDKKIFSLKEKITTLTVNTRHIQDKLSKLGTDEEICPVCLRSVKDHDIQHIDNEKCKLETEIKKFKTDITSKSDTLLTLHTLKETLKTSIDKQNNLLSEHRLKINESKTNQKNIEQFEEWNTEIDAELKNLDTENSQHDELIKTQQKRLDEIRNKITTIQHNLSILDVVKFIVSEEGVKSYIVKKILQIFNSKLAYYLSKMDANCLCIFNEYFEEEIVDEKGKVCSYYNFSGAERKNIDLACLFAFMDIRRLQGSVAYNFSIYDELLDSSLDEKGVDLVLAILKDRVDTLNEAIMIISHRKESVKIGSHHENPGDVIYLEKKNGITRRVEFKEENT